MPLDRERVLLNVRAAETEDLLDRATVYRAGMEPEALDLIEEELRSRGVGTDEIDAHARRRREAGLALHGGVARQCSFCRRPAVAEGWCRRRTQPDEVSPGRVSSVLAGPLWWLSYLFPGFPRYCYFCEEHRPRAGESAEH
jgi:hypothetical protein